MVQYTVVIIVYIHQWLQYNVVINVYIHQWLQYTVVIGVYIHQCLGSCSKFKGENLINARRRIAYFF